ncbi:MAG: GNAT family N-acetyltransferase [Oscillospiraceae bacterium]|nr:GNAT family N-acetyltransferase [Oscillospiraceae bacterium]
MRIIPYEEQYRDDMIFMVLSAKDALGRIPHLNEDLLDVKKRYWEAGTGFWLALDENDRVIGCVGYSLEAEPGAARLHRLFVKPACKRRGVGSALLETAEAAMKARGIREARVHLGEPREQWFESYAFYPKHGYREFAPRWMRKEL